MSFMMWDKIAKDERLIKLLFYVLLSFFTICLILSVALISATKERTLYIPPNIGNGAIIKTSSVDQSYVYGFAFTIWQMVNFWEHDGEIDGQKNLSKYRNYLSADFKKQLETKLKKDKLKAQGRTRILQGLHEGGLYEEVNVKKLSANSWVVYLKMRIMETYQGEVIKEKDVVFPLRISRFDVDRKINPCGLIISGFYDDTKVL